MSKPTLPFYWLLLAALCLAACAPSAPVTPSASPVPTASPVPAATSTPLPTQPPSPTPLPPTPTLPPSPTPTTFAPLSGSGGGVIAFTAEREGGMALYWMNADGSDQRRLTFDSGASGWGLWSPDGKQLTYHAVQGAQGVLKRIDLTSGQSTSIQVPLQASLWEPALAPDNRRVAFSAQSSGTTSDIYLLDPANQQLTRLTSAGGFNGGPFWSPDGKQIAFYSNRDGNFEVYVMLADGSQTRRLTDHPAEDLVTAWSPDGTRLLFFSNRGGNYDLYTINADGSGLAQLTDSPADEKEGSWSPDGKQIAFVSNQDGNQEIYLAPQPAPGSRIDPARARRLTNTSGKEMLPAWRPGP